MSWYGKEAKFAKGRDGSGPCWITGSSNVSVAAIGGGVKQKAGVEGVVASYDTNDVEDTQLATVQDRKCLYFMSYARERGPRLGSRMVTLSSLLPTVRLR